MSHELIRPARVVLRILGSSYERKHAGMIAAYFCALIVGSLATPLAFYFLAKVVGLLPNTQGWTDLVALAVAAYAAAHLMASVLEELRVYCHGWLSQPFRKFFFRFSLWRLLNNRQLLDPKLARGQFIQTLTQGQMALEDVFFQLSAAFVPLGLQALAIFVFLLTDGLVWVSLIFLVAIGVALALMVKGGARLAEAEGRAMQKGIAASGYATELVQNAETVHFMRMARNAEPRYAEMLDGLNAQTFEVFRRRLKYMLPQAVILKLALIIAVTLVIYRAIVGLGSVGSVVLVAQYGALLIQPIHILNENWMSFRRALAEFEILRPYLETDTQPDTVKSADLCSASQDDHRPAISLRGVEVHYGQKDSPSPVLTLSELDVPAGSRLGLAGASGSGKSTLVKVLAGVVVPEVGYVTIAGHDPASIPDGLATQLITAVPQEVALFNTTLLDNLRLAAPGAEEPEIWAALRTACLEDFVRSLPHGLQTQVGEGGQAVSGGQRQRIGLTRALLQDSEVILLDEAVSAIEPDLADQIMANTLAMTDKTIVVASHRARDIARCDRAITLAEGRPIRDSQSLLGPAQPAYVG